MRPRAAFLPAPLLVVLVLGCAHDGSRDPFRCPADGGPGWRELSTPHFVLRTDLPAKKARALARDLETTHDAVRRGLGRLPPEGATVRTRVVAFRSAAQYDEFAPRASSAHYFVTPFGEAVMVLPGTFGPAQRMVLAHEITHHLTRAVFARAPHWFFEGLAAYMEAVGWGGRGKAPEFGGIPPHRLRELQPYDARVRDVLAPGARVDTPQEYAVAWALVHFLRNEHPGALRRFEDRLVAGEDPAAAWRAVFPRWALERREGTLALDVALAAYLERGRWRTKRIDFRDPPPVTERALSDAEVHDTRLALPRLNRGRPVLHAAVMDEIHEALERDPRGVAALAAYATYSPPPVDARALAEKAVEGHPGDVRAWLFLAQETPAEDRAAREAVYRRALEADPKNPIALNNLAWLLVGERRWGEALPLARMAVAIAPWQPALVDTLAAVLEGLGECGEALGMQRRAVEAIPGELPEATRRIYLERLARLEAACGVRDVAPASAR